MAELNAIASSLLEESRHGRAAQSGLSRVLKGAAGACTRATMGCSGRVALLEARRWVRFGGVERAPHKAVHRVHGSAPSRQAVLETRRIHGGDLAAGRIVCSGVSMRMSRI